MFWRVRRVSSPRAALRRFSVLFRVYAFGVWGLGFEVWGLRFGVWCLVFGVWCLVFGVWCLVFGVWSLEFGVSCFGCRVYCFGFRAPVGVWWCLVSEVSVLGFRFWGFIGYLRRSCCWPGERDPG
ncbi:hypothetical protein T484DRAFT_3411273 [Baffinella frigidus]|nr:hypothetical protein T484DRAFT_3411273 [Cryptophyta sp. CCMP2293]